MYSEIVVAKGFGVRKMIAARRSEDELALQEYMERMVDVRKYQDKYKTWALFPDLKGKINRATSLLPRCYCICH
jgi:hypothetical protein